MEELRRHPVPRGAAGRAHGDLRPHGLGVGAVHERVQGSDRRLRRDPQGHQAGAAGVRPPARCVPPPARAGQERVPAPQHLRAVHRGGRRGLRPSEGRQAAEGQAQGAAAEDRRQADRWRSDRRDPGQGQRAGGSAALDHRDTRGARGRGAGGAERRGERRRARRSPGDRGAHERAREGQGHAQPDRRRPSARVRRQGKRDARATAGPGDKTPTRPKGKTAGRSTAPQRRSERRDRRPWRERRRRRPEWSRRS